ncbi:MAG: glycosyl hydrolase family 18 protein [Bacteroidota bacterium]
MRWTLLLFLLLGQITLQAQAPKVVGYLPSYRFSLNDQLAYEKLTHLNLAFLNPDTLGNWSIAGADINPIIQKARQVNPNIQIYISIAGGAVNAEWAAAYNKFMQPDKLGGFVQSLIAYANQYQLDGLDIDLEWSNVNSLYSPFVLALRDSVDIHGLGLTAALPGTYRYPEISDPALQAYDWINLMAYDLTGPWAPNNPGPHSPYSFATQSITYWQGQGLSQEQMVLGVPFYGYDFSNGGSAFRYAGMVEQDTAYAWIDQVGQRYYNGILTIRSKTALALQSCDGIMIWEIGQDAFGQYQDYSLLSVIDESINISSSIEGNWQEQLSIGPNPFQSSFKLFTDSGLALEWSLWDMQGRIVKRGQLLNGQNQMEVPTSELAAGLYHLRLQYQDQVLQQKMVKY